MNIQGDIENQTWLEKLNLLWRAKPFRANRNSDLVPYLRSFILLNIPPLLWFQTDTKGSEFFIFPRTYWKQIANIRERVLNILFVISILLNYSKPEYLNPFLVRSTASACILFLANDSPFMLLFYVCLSTYELNSHMFEWFGPYPRPFSSCSPSNFFL